MKEFDIVKVKGDTEFYQSVNRRFQAMFQFYIDGASYIDQDPNWHYFICFMDHKAVGYTTVLEDKRQVSSSGGGAYSNRVLLS